MQPQRATITHERPLRPYLELLRPPNLLTAGADVLAGFAIVSAMADASVLPLLLLTSVTLYAGGVALNDAFDAKFDEIERPGRPIPSGRAELPASFALGAALIILGVGCGFLANSSSGLLAFMIAVACVIYNAWAKHEPLLGPLMLGACRGLNLLLGVAAVPVLIGPNAWLAVAPLLYMAGVTVANHGEVHGGRRPTLFFALTSTVLVIILVAAIAGARPAGLNALPFLALFALFVLPALVRAYRAPQIQNVRRAIEYGVLGVIALDAALAAIYGGTLLGLGVIVLLPAALIVARALDFTA